MIGALLGWWYGAGWQLQAKDVLRRFDELSDNFSIGLLFRTLFSPFRQISAGSVSGPLGVQMRAWLDRLISRFIGALIRSAVIIAGLISMVIFGVVNVLILIFWPFIPLLPLVGILLAISGWVPWI
jgi:hypothetical protein